MGMIVTLTTDFGLKDHYAGAMKGAMLSAAGGIRVVDITHLVGAGNIMEGAFVMLGACPFFPRGTVHVGVVDPGVGSERRPLLVEAGGHVFVGPDNGLLSLVARSLGVTRAIELKDNRFFRPDVSTTFHGRDIFGPVAARVAAGLDPGELGPLAGPIVEIYMPRVKADAGGIHGEVVYVDSFGNLITNIRKQDLEALGAPGDVSVAGRSVGGVKKTYSTQARGSALALVGSSGYLEVAVNAGSAAEALKAGPGDKVLVRRAE